MNEKEKTDIRVNGIGLDVKTDNFTGSENKASSLSDCNRELESVQSVVAGMMRPAKTIKCYRCFACKRHFAVSRMSSALVVCRECLNATNAKGRIARRNVIDRITNDFRIFLRGRLEAR